MLQVGEDRRAEGVEEPLESGGADEVLGVCTADPSTFTENETTRTLRVAETFHLEIIGFRFPTSGDRP